MAVVIRLASAFSPEMDELRCQGFLDPNSGITTLADSFDPSSFHLTIHTDSGELIGVARLTPGSRGLLENWTNNSAPLPNIPFFDVSRIVVKAGWRRLGLYKLLVSLAVLESERMGARAVRMVTDVGLPAQRFLCALGFQIVATNLHSDDIAGLPAVLVDCVCIDIAGNRPAITIVRDTVLQRLNGP